jgi:hypothetical protein
VIPAQKAELTASDGASGDGFGVSVALSTDGSTALVGAGGKTVGGLSAAGAAYVFGRSGSSWGQQAELTASDAASGDWLGSAVALSGDGSIALVGAWAKTVGGQSEAGAAYVFGRSGSSWSQQAELAAYGNSLDAFGDAVGLSGDGSTALVGANCVNLCTGATYVFGHSGSTWSQQAELTATDAAVNDHLGASVALSTDGSTALISAPGKNNYTGAAYVFTSTVALTPTATGTSTPTNTPIPPTDVAMPPTSTPPTNTPVLPTSTALPATATPTSGSPVPASPTVFPATSTSLPATATISATQTASISPQTLSLTVSLVRRVVLGGQTLAVGLKTGAHTQVTLLVQAVTTKVVVTGKGKRRRRVTQTHVLYGVSVKGTTDAQGHFTGHLRVAYRPTRPVRAQLVVSAHEGHLTTTRAVWVTIQPPHHHR